MSFLQRLAPVRGTIRPQASDDGLWGSRGWLPAEWMGALSAAGIRVTPELAMTLSAYYSGVTMKAYDLGTLPCQMFKRRDDEGKDKVAPRIGANIGGIGTVAYRLRWQPNTVQTATEFWASMILMLELREVGYAEIVSGASGFLEQLLPRHPDRTTPERLPSGRLRYKLIEADGTPRYLTQDEMFVLRGLSLDGIALMHRTTYAAQAVGLAIAAQKAAARFFKSGMTASVVASYKGEADEEYEETLHKSIARYAAGTDNSFGLLVVPDLVDVKNLSVDPDKAQMMLAQEWGVREVARYLRMPASKLGVQGSVSYNSQVQSAVDYVIGCLRPTAILMEQSIQRDLVIAQDTYFAEFLLEALLRGDPDARAAYYEKAIRNRWMRPSEVRLRENMNPDPALDRLSEGDFRGGAPRDAGTGAAEQAMRISAGRTPRAELHYYLMTHDNATRCVRRERAVVEKLAKKHANDPAGWQAALREFYGEHAGYVAQAMRMSMDVARGYAAEHGSAFESRGVSIIDGAAGAEWERDEATELATLALEPDAAAAA
jgi:HK97 family phage portal protein